MSGTWERGDQWAGLLVFGEGQAQALQNQRVGQGSRDPGSLRRLASGPARVTAEGQPAVCVRGPRALRVPLVRSANVLRDPQAKEVTGFILK